MAAKRHKKRKSELTNRGAVYFRSEQIQLLCLILRILRLFAANSFPSDRTGEFHAILGLHSLGQKLFGHKEAQEAQVGIDEPGKRLDFVRSKSNSSALPCAFCASSRLIRSLRTGPWNFVLFYEMAAPKDVFFLCDRIREASVSLHQFLRHGHLEKVYENGLASRIRRTGHVVFQQYPLEVRDDDGTILGSFFADLLVNDHLVIELKACRSLADEHVAQLLGYLRCSRLEHGLLINFGGPKLQIRKFVLSDRF